ncbi:hypothetical protein [Neobacillus mesonae]|uniref:hypothetical protein n=1 Tax=Neobacillus mesonae TaxID=1193713 RepID=UPI002573743F|nr:hypothetical protein [Neobacillus mesonae]MED4203619.1 hypothetical protein [Neobacillus mesonae]
MKRQIFACLINYIVDLEALLANLNKRLCRYSIWRNSRNLNERTVFTLIKKRNTARSFIIDEQK